MQRIDRTRVGFTLLLILLGTTLVFGPLLPTGSAARFGIEFITIVAMASALVRLNSARWIRACAIAAGAVKLAASGMRMLDPGAAWIIAGHAAAIAFILIVAGSITTAVWREQAVTADTIVGGIAVYILLAVAWSAAYQLLEFAAPGSFTIVSDAGGHWGPWEPLPGVYPRLLFFSFITLTTLGYGDIVPASIAAAGLASAEAVVGPLYLTVLIARLVGLHIAGSRDGAGGSETPG